MCVACPGNLAALKPPMMRVREIVQIKLVPYSGKLSREKFFANFKVLWLFAKVSPQNLGLWYPK